jgi:hypothetical protein
VESQELRSENAVNDLISRGDLIAHLRDIIDLVVLFAPIGFIIRAFKVQFGFEFETPIQMMIEAFIMFLILTNPSIITLIVLDIPDQIADAIRVSYTANLKEYELAKESSIMAYLIPNIEVLKGVIYGVISYLLGFLGAFVVLGTPVAILMSLGFGFRTPLMILISFTGFLYLLPIFFNVSNFVVLTVTTSMSDVSSTVVTLTDLVFKTLISIGAVVSVIKSPMGLFKMGWSTSKGTYSKAKEFSAKAVSGIPDTGTKAVVGRAAKNPIERVKTGIENFKYQTSLSAPRLVEFATNRRISYPELRREGDWKEPERPLSEVKTQSGKSQEAFRSTTAYKNSITTTNTQTQDEQTNTRGVAEPVTRVSRNTMHANKNPYNSVPQPRITEEIIEEKIPSQPKPSMNMRRVNYREQPKFNKDRWKEIERDHTRPDSKS